MLINSNLLGIMVNNGFVVPFLDGALRTKHILSYSLMRREYCHKPKFLLRSSIVVIYILQA
eukprot:c18456_g1_i1 orf=325-507(+)